MTDIQIHDTKTLMVLKTYPTETPLNSAALATARPYVNFSQNCFLTSMVHSCDFKVLLGGGQEAMSVTTTSTRQGKFETRFWHKVFEEEVGRVKGHFGPINTLVYCIVSSIIFSLVGHIAGLPSIPLGTATRQEERTDLCGCIISTRRTLGRSHTGISRWTIDVQ